MADAAVSTGGDAPLEAFVLSYNRGPHLAWCLDSLARHAGGLPVTVLDDGSDDPATLAALEAAPFPVRRGAARGPGRLGGLYANMQAAFDGAAARRVLFVQDDCQLIRPLDASVLAELDAVLAADPAQAVVSPLIRMGPRQARREGAFEPAAGGAAWHYLPQEGAGSVAAQHYTAISILDRARLIAAGWRFEATEGGNARQAMRLGLAPMAHLDRPFAAQLPEVPTSRWGRPTLGARIAARLDGPEVRGFRDLSPAQVEALGGGAQPPLAEDVLTPTHPRTRRPYVHKGVNGRGWTRALNRVELMLRRR